MRYSLLHIRLSASFNKRILSNMSFSYCRRWQNIAQSSQIAGEQVSIIQLWRQLNHGLLCWFPRPCSICYDQLWSPRLAAALGSDSIDRTVSVATRGHGGVSGEINRVIYRWFCANSDGRNRMMKLSIIYQSRVNRAYIRLTLQDETRLRFPSEILVRWTNPTQI
jgi:hypothetical protein